MFLLGTLRALPPVVNPNLIVIKIFKASVATLFQKLIIRPKIDKKSREKNQEKFGKKSGKKSGKNGVKTEGKNQGKNP